jgi:hypothetical protein
MSRLARACAIPARGESSPAGRSDDPPTRNTQCSAYRPPPRWKIGHANIVAQVMRYLVYKPVRVRFGKRRTNAVGQIRIEKSWDVELDAYGPLAQRTPKSFRNSIAERV